MIRSAAQINTLTTDDSDDDSGRLSSLKMLNIGCGTDIREDYINLDVAPLPGVDVVHSLTELPLPFPSGKFQKIVCQDILEHLDIVPTMRELHRLLKPGGILEIRVPHFTSANTYIDPTHVRAFSVRTFDFFLSNNSRSYYFEFGFSKILERFITFKKGKSHLPNFAIEPLVNSSLRMQQYYENSALRIFPAENLIILMQK